MLVAYINSCGLVVRLLSGTIVCSIVTTSWGQLALLHNSFRTVCCSYRDDECLRLTVQTVHGLIARVAITGLLWSRGGLGGLEIEVGRPPQGPGCLQALLAVTARTVGLDQFGYPGLSGRRPLLPPHHRGSPRWPAGGRDPGRGDRQLRPRLGTPAGRRLQSGRRQSWLRVRHILGVVVGTPGGGERNIII